MRKIALILAVFTAAALAAPAAAWAYDCDSKVVDEAGKLTADDASNVNMAIQNLENQGAEVRVRTVVNFGGSGYATLDAYEHALMQSCPSWQAVNGHTKSNLVVFMLSYNAGDKIKAGLYYGEEWMSQIKGQWPTLLSQGVGPMVRAGRHGDAVARALNGIAGFITPVQPNVAPAERAPAQPPVVIDNRKPTNLAGLWYVLGGLVLLGAGLALFFLLRSRKRDREAAQAVQQDAQAVKASCGAKIMEFDDASMAILDSKVNSVADAFSDEESAPLRAQLAAFKQKVVTATAEFAEMQQGNNDPSFNDYGAESYRRIAASYRSILGQLHEADSLKAGVEDAAKALSRKTSETPEKIAKAKAAAAAATAQVKTTKDGGYRLPETLAKRIEQQTTAMDAAIVAADAALANKRHGDALKSAAEATKLAADLTASAQEMPTLRAAIEKSLAAFTERVNKAEPVIETVQPMLTEIMGAYVASSWMAVKGNLTAASAEVVKAQANAKRAAACATMQTQDWGGAQAELEAGTKALDRANDLVVAVQELKTTLETAKRDTANDLALLRRKIAAGRAFIKENAADIASGHASEIDAAEKPLADAEAELRKAQPDYLAARKTVKTAQAAFDAALKAARGEHEAKERKRQEAEAARQEAIRQEAARQEAARQEAARLERERVLAQEREIARQQQFERDQAYARQRDLDLITTAAAVTAAEAIADAANRNASNDYPSYGGGGYSGGGGGYSGGGSTSIDTTPDSDGGGGSISIDSTPSGDGGGGSVGFDSSPSSDGGGGSDDI